MEQSLQGLARQLKVEEKAYQFQIQEELEIRTLKRLTDHGLLKRTKKLCRELRPWIEKLRTNVIPSGLDTRSANPSLSPVDRSVLDEIVQTGENLASRLAKSLRPSSGSDSGSSFPIRQPGSEPIEDPLESEIDRKEKSHETGVESEQGVVSHTGVRSDPEGQGSLHGNPIHQDGTEDSTEETQGRVEQVRLRHVSQYERLLAYLVDERSSIEVRDGILKNLIHRTVWKPTEVTTLERRVRYLRRLFRRVNQLVDFAFVESNPDNVSRAICHKRWQIHLWLNQYAGLTAPRDHGKTTEGLIHLCLRLAENTQTRIKIVSAGDAEAEKRLVWVRGQIETNYRYKRIFPHVVKSQVRDNWNNDSFTIARTHDRPDSSVEAKAIFSSATGGRCDLLFLDDPVDFKNALKEPALIPKTKTAIKSTWLNLVESDGDVLCLGQRWVPNDFISEIRDSKVWKWVIDVIDENMTPIWGEKWGKKELRVRMELIDVQEFNRGFRDIPFTVENQIFTVTRIKKYSSVPSSLRFYQSHDLAIKQGKDNSKYAFCEAGVNSSSDVFVTKVFKGQIQFNEQVDFCLQMGKDRAKDLHAVIFEVNQYQEALAQEVERLSILPIERVTSLENKTIRSSRIARVLSKIYVPEDDSCKELVDDLEAWPYGDMDLVDAFCQLVEHVMGGTSGPIEISVETEPDARFQSSTRSKEESGPRSVFGFRESVVSGGFFNRTLFRR